MPKTPTRRRRTDRVSPRSIAPDEKARKVALIEAGYTISDVATEAGVTRQTAWQVFKRRTTSRRVQEVFARLTGRTVDELFPEPVTAAA